MRLSVHRQLMQTHAGLCRGLCRILCSHACPYIKGACCMGSCMHALVGSWWTAMLSPCLVCQELSEGPRCPDHRPTTTELRGLSPAERGYNHRWTLLSKLARKLQPWCSDCGRVDDLTADHLPSAWARKAAGRPLRLADVLVLCADCNSKRGSSRPGSARATLGDRPAPVSTPTGNQGQVGVTHRRLSI